MKSPKPILIFHQTHNPDIKLIKTAQGNVEVHRCGTIIGVRGREICLGVTPKGYRQAAAIAINGKTYNYRVSRLVAMAFIPNSDGLPEVDHKDDNKLNNHADNLQWLTGEQNRDKAGNGSISIIATKIKTGERNIYPSSYAAGKDGFNFGCINLCVRGFRSQHKGYYWDKVIKTLNISGS